MNSIQLREQASRLLQEATVNQLAGFVTLSKELMLKRAEIMKQAEALEAEESKQEHEESFYEGMEDSNEPDFLDEPTPYQE